MNDSNNNLNHNNQNQKNDLNNTNNNSNKTNINNNRKDNDINNNKISDNNLDTFFCFDKNDPAQNKKIIELLIIFNVVTIIIVLYILSSIYNFRIEFDNTDENEDDYDDNNKLTYLTFIRNPGNNYNQNFRDLFEENLDLLNKGDDGITSSSSKEDYLEKKKKKNNERYSYYSNNLY